MKSSTTTTWQDLVIPITIAAVAFVSLSSRLENVAESFFAHNLLEQVSWMMLVFSVVFTAVIVSRVATVVPPNALLKNLNPINYPIDDMQQATSDAEMFKCLFPLLKSQIIKHMQDDYNLPDEAQQWVQNMLDYNVPGGKLNRGITVMNVYQTLNSNKQGTPTKSPKKLQMYELAQAAVLGWTIEFLQAFFLVADDVMDGSISRRNQPCWYKLDHVQLISINDSFLLESFVFMILKDHFYHLPCYHDLVELFLTVIRQTEFGQLLDLTSQPMSAQQQKHHVELSRFTMHRYQQIVQFKTAYYSFYLPVALGLLLSGKSMHRHANDFAKAQEICLAMGEYFQIQDDYLDCFGDVETIGKVGTDIQDNKCSWLVVQALERCNDKQRKVLEQNYGAQQDKKVQKIKDLYRELELPQVFAEYEESSYRAIQAKLDQLTDMPRDVFELLLKKIYKRSK